MWNTFKDFVKGLSNSRIAIVVIVYLLFFAILGNRLFTLQIVKNMPAKQKKVHEKQEQ